MLAVLSIFFFWWKKGVTFFYGFVTGGLAGGKE